MLPCGQFLGLACGASRFACGAAGFPLGARGGAVDDARVGCNAAGPIHGAANRGGAVADLAADAADDGTGAAEHLSGRRRDAKRRGEGGGCG
jgi:hypothetical protein